MRAFHVSVVGGQAPVPQVQPRLLVLIGAWGCAACALSIVAEFTRTKHYQIKENAAGQLVCNYDPSSATLYASLAAVCLTIAQALATIAGGLAWARPLFQRHMADNKAMVGRAVQRVVIVAIMNLLFFLAAVAILVSAAIENKFHVSAVPYGQMFMSCTLVSEGLFLSAAALSVITAVLMLAYYVYAARANEELWLCNYVAAPVVVDMEAFSKEAARTSITAIISDKRGDGGASGRMDSISNTPIRNARLA